MNTLKGIPTSAGKVKGRVRIVLTDEDFSKFKPGMILVAKTTTPDWTPLILIARGIVTDLGGSLCHAAIISREMGIPCVVGTNDATKVLRDGDLVEIYGEKGIVKILEDKTIPSEKTKS